MTVVDLMALMPLIILTAGCVLCLLAGAVRPGFYLYGAAIAVVAAALLWSVLVPTGAVMPGCVECSAGAVTLCAPPWSE